jgi:hypothetical protein
MKNIFRSGCGLLVALVLVIASTPAFASGVVAIDSPQSGTLTFSNATQYAYTNSFSSPAFSETPVMVFTVPTNAQPYTNIFTTATNFAISLNTTNVQIKWQAYSGFKRIQSGQLSVTANTLITNSFTVPYVETPVMWLQSDQATSAATNTPYFSSVTTTNFIVTAVKTNQVINWMSFGTAVSIGKSTITY